MNEEAPFGARVDSCERVNQLSYPPPTGVITGWFWIRPKTDLCTCVTRRTAYYLKRQILLCIFWVKVECWANVFRKYPFLCTVSVLFSVITYGSLLWDFKVLLWNLSCFLDTPFSMCGGGRCSMFYPAFVSTQLPVGAVAFACATRMFRTSVCKTTIIEISLKVEAITGWSFILGM